MSAHRLKNTRKRKKKRLQKRWIDLVELILFMFLSLIIGYFVIWCSYVILR